MIGVAPEVGRRARVIWDEHSTTDKPVSNVLTSEFGNVGCRYGDLVTENNYGLRIAARSCGPDARSLQMQNEERRVRPFFILCLLARSAGDRSAEPALQHGFRLWPV